MCIRSDFILHFCCIAQYHRFLQNVKYKLNNGTYSEFDVFESISVLVCFGSGDEHRTAPLYSIFEITHWLMQSAFVCLRATQIATTEKWISEIGQIWCISPHEFILIAFHCLVDGINDEISILSREFAATRPIRSDAAVRLVFGSVTSEHSVQSNTHIHTHSIIVASL